MSCCSASDESSREHIIIPVEYACSHMVRVLVLLFVYNITLPRITANKIQEKKGGGNWLCLRDALVSVKKKLILTDAHTLQSKFLLFFSQKHHADECLPDE